MCKQREFHMVTCEARHYIPQAKDGFIFPNHVDDMHDYNGLYRTAWTAIPDDCETLFLYVTGLTPCTLAVVQVCQMRGIHLICCHYDRDSNEYRHQDMELLRVPF